jgi:nucleoside-diphosphate-sugar epimerase
MATVLVTGATGFLGGYVVRKLAALGCEVIATGRDKAKLDALQAKSTRVLALPLEHLSIETHGAALKGITSIVHCAALSSPWGRDAAFETANVVATQRLINVATALGVKRFVLVSTPSVYFRYADQLNVSETQILPPPVNAYARTKRAAEALVLAHPEIGPIVLRPRGLYGKGDTALLPRLLRSVAKGPIPLLRDGIAATDITHVEDVADAIIAALGAPMSATGEIFNISGGVALPLKSIIEQASRMNGLTPKWRVLPLNPLLALTGLNERVRALLPSHPEPVVTRYGLGILAFSQTLNIQKAQASLKWTPKISFEEGLQRTFSQREHAP